MRRDKKFLLERIFELIQNLNQKERKQFRSFVNKISFPEKNKEGQPSYLKLYLVLEGGKKFCLERIRKKMGSTDRKVLSAAFNLKKVLLESLAYYESSSFNGASVAKKAIEKGFIRYAEQIIQEELRVSIQSESLPYLHELYGLVRTLERFYKVPCKEIKELLPREVFLEEYSLLIKLDSFILDAREAVRLPSKTRKARSIELQSQLDNLGVSNLFVHCKAMRLKAQVLVHIVGFDNFRASNLQEELVNLIRENVQILGREWYVEETNTLISILIELEKFESAKEFLHDIIGLEGSSEFEKSLTRIWIINSIFIAACTGDKSLGLRGERDFEENLGLFSPRWKALVFHALAVFYCYHGGWRKVIFWQNKLAKLHKDSIRGLELLPIILKAISFLELGYFGDARKILKKESSFDKTEGITYFNFAVKFLRNLCEVTESPKSYLILLKQTKKELSRFQNNPDFAYQLNYFDLSLWIESKLNQTSIFDLIVENPELRFMRIKLVS